MYNSSNPQATPTPLSVESKLEVDGSTNSSIISPGRLLADLVGAQATIKLRGGHEYTGELVSYDLYYNVRLKNCTERNRSGAKGNTVLDDVFIRCNNIHLIYPALPQAAS